MFFFSSKNYFKFYSHEKFFPHSVCFVFFCNSDDDGGALEIELDGVGDVECESWLKETFLLFQCVGLKRISSTDGDGESRERKRFSDPWSFLKRKWMKSTWRAINYFKICCVATTRLAQHKRLWSKTNENDSHFVSPHRAHPQVTPRGWWSFYIFFLDELCCV